MNPEQQSSRQTISFTLLTAMLIALLAALAVVMFVLIARLEDPTLTEPHRRYFISLAALSGGLMVIMLGLLGLLIIRRLGRKIARSAKQEPTAYVNAWELAGKRLKLDDHPPTPNDQPEGDDEDAPK